ncbi:hypothetical protein [Endozoicomonas acroporae]
MLVSESTRLGEYFLNNSDPDRELSACGIAAEAPGTTVVDRLLNFP